MPAKKITSTKNGFRFRSEIILAVFLLIILSVLNFISFKESLKTALSGDDWLMVYTIWMDSVVRKAVSYWNIKTYLSTYGPPYGFMSIIIHYFGYEPYYYYLVSLVTRIGASLSIFYMIRRFTKNFAVSFLSSVFFAVSYIGIQSTDWVFNFNHYIGIIFGSLFLITYISSKEKQTLTKVLLSGLIFALCLLVSPNRMHGLLPLVLVFEIAWFLIETRSYDFKKALIRILILLIAYKIVFSGTGYGSTEYNLSLVRKGYGLAVDLLSSGQFWFILNPLSSLGNYIVPDLLYQKLPLNEITAYLGRPGSFFAQTLIILGSIGALGSLILILLRSKISALMHFAASLLCWSLVMKYVKILNPINYSPTYAGYAVIGGGITIFTFFLFFNLKKNYPYLAHTFLVSLGWMFAFTLFPWVLAPYGVLETTIRYSIQQAIGNSIWFSVIFYTLFAGIFKIRWFRFLLLPSAIILFLFLYMNISFSNQYFRKLNMHRGSVLDKKLWSQITSTVTEIPKNKSSLFYLKYDDYLTSEIGLRSGFSARAAMHYDIRNQNNNPYMVFDYTDVQSIVTTGEAWTNQGEPVDITPLNYVFAFELEKNNIRDVTEEVRSKLAKEIKEQNGILR